MKSDLRRTARVTSLRCCHPEGRTRCRGRRGDEPAGMEAWRSVPAMENEALAETSMATSLVKLALREQRHFGAVIVCKSHSVTSGVFVQAIKEMFHEQIPDSAADLILAAF